MYDFSYHRPATIAEASALIADAEDGVYLAGGQTLVSTLKQRLAQPSDVIDLGRIDGLDGVKSLGGVIEVGAMTRHGDVAASPDVQKAIPALAVLAGMIGDPQVRNRGTIGGSLATNDPAADYPAAVLGLNATVHTDKREIAADDFFMDLFETALMDGEIITKVSFPLPERAGYAKFPNPASRYAMVGVMVADLDDAAEGLDSIEPVNPAQIDHIAGLGEALLEGGHQGLSPGQINPVLGRGDEGRGLGQGRRLVIIEIIHGHEPCAQAAMALTMLW